LAARTTAAFDQRGGQRKNAQVSVIQIVALKFHSAEDHP
jgi:hypothetical protein